MRRKPLMIRALALISPLALLASCGQSETPRDMPPGDDNPSIGISTTTMAFTVNQGTGNPPSQTLQLSNDGSDTLDWSITTSSFWLTVSPTSGSTSSGSQTLTVDVDVATLFAAASPYTGQITIASDNADDAPQQIDVTVNITPLTCEPLASTIDADTRLMAGCYDVESGVSVQATLTLDPGVTLVFHQGAGMTVEPGGRLSAVGTEGSPILLTADERLRGYWNGLRFNRSNSTTNRLEYVTIEYGGGVWDGNVYLDGTSDAPSRLAVNHCTLRESGSYGFYFDVDAIVEEFSEVTATANTMGAGSVSANVTGYLQGNGTYSGNDDDLVEIRGGTVAMDQTWPGIDARYLITSSVSVAAALTIEPGAELSFGQGRDMTVTNEGHLVAAGTAQDSILLTGEEAVRGFWGGLRFNRSNSTNNRLDHVTIEYAGAVWNGNLYLDGTSTEPSRAAVSNCTLQHGSKYGFYFDSDAVIEDFSAITSTMNTSGAGSVTADNVGSIEDDGTFTGNDVDVVEVRGGTVSTAQAWQAIDAQYLLTTSVQVIEALTLDPGVELVFGPGRELTITGEGQLIAVGTLADRILFTGLEQTAGFWGGLRFNRSNWATNALELCTFEYGGGVWNGNVFVDGTSAEQSQVDIRNCSFRNSASYGIYLDADAVVNGDLEMVNTFSSNADGTVRFP